MYLPPQDCMIRACVLAKESQPTPARPLSGRKRLSIGREYKILSTILDVRLGLGDYAAEGAEVIETEGLFRSSNGCGSLLYG